MRTGPANELVSRATAADHERTEFEKWMRAHHPRTLLQRSFIAETGLRGDGYAFQPAQARWEGWKACAATQIQQKNWAITGAASFVKTERDAEFGYAFANAVPVHVVIDVPTSDAEPRVDELRPCPFCGKALYVKARRSNPYARCNTEGCKATQLPLLNLDQPDDVAAWNQRAVPCKVCSTPATQEAT